MARSTRSRRTTTKTEDAENVDTPSQEFQDSSERSEKKTRRTRKHENKDSEQKEEATLPKENTPESDGQNTQSPQEVTEKGRRGRKKREEDEAESENRSSSTKRARSRRTQKEEEAVVETQEGDVTRGGKRQRGESNEQVSGAGDTGNSRSKERRQLQEDEKAEKSAEDAEKDLPSRSRRHPSEDGHKKQVNKTKDTVGASSSKPSVPESQKALRMDVEEEKLDFEIEDELQLKVQNDEVLDGDDEDTKEEDDQSRTTELPCREEPKNSKDDEINSKDSKDSEKLIALDEMLKRRASRRNHWPAEKESGPDKDKENLEGSRDRWGKLAEKTPSKEHAQAIVTTDSLKELSKEMEAKVTKKDTTDQKDSDVSEETKSPLADEEGKSASSENARQPEATPVDDTRKSATSDAELEDRRRARHISMSDTPADNSGGSSGKEAIKDSESKVGRAKLPSAGLALGSTNWTELETTRRKPREAATPPRLPVARYLLVLNLVRPFTLGQLTDLVTHAGARSISDLWLDRIKSKAIVEFSDESASQEAREELHNIVWPKGSPKTIKCEFLTEGEVEQTKAGAAPSLQREPCQNPEKDKERSKKETTKERTRIVVGPSEEARDNGDLRKTIEVHKEKGSEESRRRKATAEGESQPAPAKKIREWDLPKLKQQQHQEQHEPRQPQNSEEPATAKRLEDLFRKTKATPNIYWIPLPEAEAVERAKVRAEKQKEEDRRHRNRRLMMN